MIPKFFTPIDTEIEPAALHQLSVVANHPNTLDVIGMHDLHVGKGGPVGMAMLGKLPVPSIVGGDLGCGFALFRLSLKPKRLADPDWIASRLDGLDAPWEGSMPDLGFETEFDYSLGTLGSNHSNHFAEIQVVDQTNHPSVAVGEALLLIHTGSRGLGDRTFRNISAICRDNPLENSEEWLRAHDRCVIWAKANRNLVAQRVAEHLNTDVELIFDMPHNFVEQTTDGFLHRKGAAPSDRGLSVIPGSRGTPTYLMAPTSSTESLNSLPHGAGRRMSRSAAREGTQNRKMLQEAPALSTNRRGGLVVCGDDDLLLEERPRAYKDVTAVMNGVVLDNLATMVAEMHPVVTFKSSEVQKLHRDRSRTPEAKKRDIEKRSRR